MEKSIRKIKWKQLLRNYLFMTAASVIYGIGIALFLDPNNLAPGGVAGVAILLNRVTGLEVGTWNLIINIPIMIFGLWKFGLHFCISTVYTTALCSIFINVFSGFTPFTTQPLLAALAGGVCIAIALGIVFKAGATTGGMDIIVKALRRKYKHMKTGTLYLLVDLVVVIAAGIVFQDFNAALYAMIAVIVTGKVFDQVLYGKDEAKLIYIISDHSEEIAYRLLEDLEIGVTYLKGKGAYQGQEKQVILCVMRDITAPKAEEIIKEEDPRAFMIVTSATEIYGEGYKDIFEEKI